MNIRLRRLTKPFSLLRYLHAYQEISTGQHPLGSSSTHRAENLFDSRPEGNAGQILGRTLPRQNHCPSTASETKPRSFPRRLHVSTNRTRGEHLGIAKCDTFQTKTRRGTPH